MIYPNINPVFLDLGFFQIHWYGVMYLISFISVWFLMNYKIKNNKSWDKKQVEDLMFFGMLGVIIGGRLGYMFFYNFPIFLNNPLTLLKIWQGGMSFHGGFLGVLLAIYLFAKKNNKTFFEITDFIAPFVPIGLGLGRIGNFINAELWGKITNSPLGMYAPDSHLPNAVWAVRYPSQLYEALLEGLVLFLILWFFSTKPKPKMAISALFLIAYGFFRFIVEFVRVPDVQLGYLAFDWLTMGQVLSFPMILLGIVLLFMAYKSKP